MHTLFTSLTPICLYVSIIHFVHYTGNTLKSVDLFPLSYWEEADKRPAGSGTIRYFKLHFIT